MTVGLLALAIGGVVWAIAIPVSVVFDVLSPLLLIGELLMVAGLWGQRDRRRPPETARIFMGASLVAFGIAGTIWPLVNTAIAGVLVWLVYPVVVILGPAAISIWGLAVARGSHARGATLVAGGMLATSIGALAVANALPAALIALAFIFGLLAVGLCAALARTPPSGVVSPRSHPEGRA